MFLTIYFCHFLYLHSLCIKSCLGMFTLSPFSDLINSKVCTNLYKLLNLSDRQKLINQTFKNAIYYTNSENLHAALETHHTPPPRAGAAAANRRRLASPPPPPRLIITTNDYSSYHYIL